MPLIRLETSCNMPDSDTREALAQKLSACCAAGIGKPEQYVMALVKDQITMTMSGQAGPAALVTIKSIGGLDQAVNQGLSRELCVILQEALDIPPDRIYLTFSELGRSDWGWNGTTFG